MTYAVRQRNPARTKNGPGWYFTEYRAAGHSYLTSMWASSRVQARRKVKERGLGEKLIDAWPSSRRWQGEMRASETVRTRRPVATKMHALVWLANLALSSKVLGRDEVLGDGGFLHEGAHLFLGIGTAYGKSAVAFSRHLEAIERRVPGYLAPAERPA